MPTIFDNSGKDTKLLKRIDELVNKAAYKADFCVGYFKLTGWGLIADAVESFEGGDDKCCRILVGMDTSERQLIRQFKTESAELISNSTFDKIKDEVVDDFKKQLAYGFPKSGELIALRKLIQQLKNEKVKISLYTEQNLHAKLYICYTNEVTTKNFAFLGSSNLTYSGLLGQGELNTDVTDKHATAQLVDWFEDRWDNTFSEDISEDLIRVLDEGWASENLRSPFHIYLKIAYHLSGEARIGVNEYSIPKIFRGRLLKFQEEAVQIASRHLFRKGGVLIGDVVGLGKTFTATAIAKIAYDEHRYGVLVLCPANLQPMWKSYMKEFKVRDHEVLSTAKAESLNDPEMEKYQVVIIDESHNLRNSRGKRYLAIREYIEKHNSKVVLLSATPYNKAYSDLSNQLRLFLDEEEDLKMYPEELINSLGSKEELSRKFSVGPATLAAFEKSEFSADWQQLLSRYFVRRTRSFIKNTYGKYDPEADRKYLEFPDGSRSYFPDRKPVNFSFDFSEKDPDDQYAKFYSESTVEVIGSLALPRYGMKTYIKDFREPASAKENEIIKNLSTAGQRLIGFCRTGLFKRLESSGYSFLLSLSRHAVRNHVFIYAIENNLPLPIGPQDNSLFDDLSEDEDPDNDSLETFYSSDADYRALGEKAYRLFETEKAHKFSWIRPVLFSDKLADDLREDSRQIGLIVGQINVWNEAKDKKLNGLADLCLKTHPTDKVLIFTQYADTATYIAKGLKKRGVKSCEFVSGNSDNPTEYAKRFSPNTNKAEELAGSDQEIRVLIATDVLSEGHNLQDARIVVNFDLPWAIIRLIQRAGRVDRIGQKATEILCYSFLPDKGLENIIALRARLSRRMGQNAEVIGSDEQFFDGEKNVRLMTELYNEKAGVLDEEDETDDTDLTSKAYEVWNSAVKENPQLAEQIKKMPGAVFTGIKKAIPAAEKGSIVFLRSGNDNDHLVQYNEAGEVVSTNQTELFRRLACDPAAAATEVNPVHHQNVETASYALRELEAASETGRLGRKNSARYRLYHSLKNYLRENPLFAGEDLAATIDKVYKNPLTAKAKEITVRHFREKAGPEDLVNAALSLYEREALCKEISENRRNELPEIVCSLSIQ